MKHVIAGLVAICLGICGLVVWFSTFGMVMRGLVPFLLLVGGFVAVLSGYRRMTAASREAAEEDFEDEDEDEELADEDEQDEGPEDFDAEREAKRALANRRRRAAMN